MTPLIREGGTFSGRMTAWRARPSTRAWRRVASRGTSRSAGQAGVGQEGDGGDAGAVELVVDALVDGALVGVDEGAVGEGQPDLALGPALVVEGDELGQELLGALPRVGGRAQGADAGPGAVAHQLHGEAQQLGLGREVVAQRAHGQAGLAGDVADGGPLEPVAADDRPHRLGDRRPALFGIDQLRHATFIAQLCYHVVIAQLC